MNPTLPPAPAVGMVPIRQQSPSDLHVNPDGHSNEPLQRRPPSVIWGL